VKTVFMGESYAGLRGFEDFLVMVQPKGVFQLARFETAESEPKIIMNREAIDHDEDIMSVDYRQDLKLLLTSGKDGRVKVWTTAKILIYEIVVDEQLQYVLWGHNSDVLLFSSNKLYCLRKALLLS
jgi:WD40 repeat protein